MIRAGRHRPRNAASAHEESDVGNAFSKGVGNAFSRDVGNAFSKGVGNAFSKDVDGEHIVFTPFLRPPTGSGSRNATQKPPDDAGPQ